MSKSDFKRNILFFRVKIGKKIIEIWGPKNILKIISARKKVGKFFLLDYPSIIPSLNYGWKRIWCSVSAVPWWYFSWFLLRLSSRFVRWHGHNCKTKHGGPSKVVSFDSEGLSYSTKVPSDLFLTYGIMFKKILDAKENERRPCRMCIGISAVP